MPERQRQCHGEVCKEQEAEGAIHIGAPALQHRMLCVSHNGFLSKDVWLAVAEGGGDKPYLLVSTGFA